MSTAVRTLPTPVYAVVGAGDAAVQEVKDAVASLKTRAVASKERAQTRVGETRSKLTELPSEVPSLDELRAKLTTDELRKVANPYIERTVGRYNSLAERGESAVERLRQQPVVADNLTRVEKVYSDAVELTEEALGAVSEQTRAVGERAAALAGRTADKVQDAAVVLEDASDKVEDAAVKVAVAGDKVKTQTAAAAKKAPAKKAPAKRAPAKKAAAKAPATKTVASKPATK